MIRILLTALPLALCLCGAAESREGFLSASSSNMFWMEGLLISIVAFVALFVWEIFDRPASRVSMGDFLKRRNGEESVDPFELVRTESSRSDGDVRQAHVSSSVSAPVSREPVPEEDDDPFKSLLKTSSRRSEEAVQPVAARFESVYREEPAAAPPPEPAPAAPAYAVSYDDFEDDDPFKKLLKKQTSAVSAEQRPQEPLPPAAAEPYGEAEEEDEDDSYEEDEEAVVSVGEFYGDDDDETDGEENFEEDGGETETAALSREDYIEVVPRKTVRKISSSGEDSADIDGGGEPPAPEAREPIPVSKLGQTRSSGHSRRRGRRKE